MAIQTLILYPRIRSIEILKDKVDALTQDHQSADDLKTAIESWVAAVKKYDSMGYYPLVKPEFISDVIRVFGNTEFSKADVIADNCYQNIKGYPQCSRIFQLPDAIKDEARDLLKGYEVTFDDDSWAVLSVILLVDEA